MFSWVQERILAITNERIYNIKKNKKKRQIEVIKKLCNLNETYFIDTKTAGSFKDVELEQWRIYYSC